MFCLILSSAGTESRLSPTSAKVSRMAVGKRCVCGASLRQLIYTDHKDILCYMILPSALKTGKEGQYYNGATPPSSILYTCTFFQSFFLVQKSLLHKCFSLEYSALCFQCLNSSPIQTTTTKNMSVENSRSICVFLAKQGSCSRHFSVLIVSPKTTLGIYQKKITKQQQQKIQ